MFGGNEIGWSEAKASEGAVKGSWSFVLVLFGKGCRPSRWLMPMRPDKGGVFLRDGGRFAPLPGASGGDISPTTLLARVSTLGPFVLFCLGVVMSWGRRARLPPPSSSSLSLGSHSVLSQPRGGGLPEPHSLAGRPSGFDWTGFFSCLVGLVLPG